MFITQPRAKKNALVAPPKRKRKAGSAVEEISFDDAARADYLTGFHKRKVQRQKQAQEIAVEKARQERIAFRKQIREQRKEAVEEHVQQVNEALRAARVAGGEAPDDDDEKEGEGEGEGDDDDNTSWDGIADEPPAFVDHMAEYVDEEKFTTVTVDAVSVDRDGMHRLAGGSSDEEGDGDGSGPETDKPKHDAGVGAEDGKEADKGGRKKKEWPAKTKKKKFRYENKIERQVSKQKQKRSR